MTGSEPARKPPSPDARDRVPRSHAQTRISIRMALAFLAAAALAGAWTTLREWPQPRWLPLHLFLAGGITLAISGVSLMLTVTWATAPAPSDRLAWLQRGAIAIGAAGITIGRTSGAHDAVTGTAALVHIAGMGLLAWLLATTMRRGTIRRFDPAVIAYLTAIAAALAGDALGATLATSAASAGVRSAHLTVNLLGFVGIVIGGTLPFFASTVGRSKMAKAATPPRLLAVTGWQAASVAIAAIGLVTESGAVTSAGLGAYAVGIVATVALMPRLTRRTLEWSGPRILALWAGSAWWVVAVIATAIDVVADHSPFTGRWLPILVLIGYAQILWGSLAYLLPMLRGGGHIVLGEGFAATRSWVGFAAVNIAGALLVLGWEAPAMAAAAIFLIDGAWRASRVGTRRVERTDAPARTAGAGAAAPAADKTGTTGTTPSSNTPEP